MVAAETRHDAVKNFMVVAEEKRMALLEPKFALLTPGLNISSIPAILCRTALF